MKKLKEFKPLLEIIKEEKWKLIIAVLLIFISELSGILHGYLNGAAVEEITKLHINDALLYLGLYLIVLIVSDCFIDIGASSMLKKIEKKITSKLQLDTYIKSLNLPSYAYEKMSSGELINRITSDTDVLSFTFYRFISMLSSMISSVIILVYVFFNSWIIGVEIILFLIVLYFIIKKFDPQLEAIHKERGKKYDKFTSLVTESVRGIREIKTLGIKNNLIHNLQEVIKSLFKTAEKEIDTSRNFNIYTKILKSFIEVGVFTTCIILIYYGKASITFFIAMTYYIYRYTWLIENINDLTQNYQKIVVSLTRVNELLENRMYNDEEFGTSSASNVNGVVEFKNVYFAYPDEAPILNDFNLKLEPNRKIAIVGKSGQGKTTLFNLMTRVFDPISGSITLDGVDIKDLKEEDLRKNISIIRQEPFIFNKTILENFKLLDENITLEQVRKYSKEAYLDDYIMSLPNGYDTLLGEGGVNLSGGQKQRLAIARTLAKESKVILFDEATSSLDNNSQEYIKESVDSLVKNHTVIIVAHRLSTIIDADIIYVIDGSKVVASGTHNELLKSSAVYKNLYEVENK